jgi:hypothetical protein
MFTAAGRECAAGELVLHRCDVRACCNPAHLFAGTHRVNSRDCAAKQRLYLQSNGHVYDGESNPRAKLTWAQVTQIRALRGRGRTQSSLAQEFGISPGHVSRIVRGHAFLSMGAPK